ASSNGCARPCVATAAPGGREPGFCACAPCPCADDCGGDGGRADGGRAGGGRADPGRAPCDAGGRDPGRAAPFEGGGAEGGRAGACDDRGSASGGSGGGACFGASVAGFAAFGSTRWSYWPSRKAMSIALCCSFIMLRTMSAIPSLPTCSA